MVESTSGSNVVEETSPDLLKNTPSNIRRLADEIEQCEGRQKYLAHTVSPSDGGDVRWYFCKVPLALNEPAAAVPHTEIVGHGDYFRFGMRDSLAIEALFLQREEELLSLWWKEYAECSEGPSELPSKLNSMSVESSPVNSESAEQDAVEEERVGVPVKGGLYEVYLAKRHCFPVYWNGENRRVLRGHWFACKGGLDWLPLREDVAEQLEYAYCCKVWRRRSFQPSGLYAARVDLQGSTLMQGLHALFTGEDDTWEAWLSVDTSGFSGVLRFGGNGVKLRRGYASSQSPKPTQDELRQKKEEEMDDYCSQVPVRHLVFMVHGIGQRLEKSNLVDDVGDFRHVTASLAERHLSPYQLGTQRVLFIPCQWRKGLKLGGEAAVEKITLDGVRGFRTMLSATVHDVLYYMSPIYCQAIIDSVSNQLNRLYLKFLKRNPGYNGKVSIYGHSLGSVLSYDILCHQEILSSPFPMEWMYRGENEKKVSFPDKSEVSLDQNVTTIVDDESLVSDRSKNIVNMLGNDITEVDQSCSGLVEECTEFLCHSVSPPALSDSDEAAINSVDIKQHDDRNDLGPSEQDMTYDSEIAECRDTGSDHTKIEGELESDKDKMIRSLREEIDLLTAKIRELDCWRGPEGKKGQETNTINQSEKDFSKESDSHKNYTPCIKYTKLAFKVDTFFAVGSPLGVFLSLRNVRIGIGKGLEYWEEEKINEEMPACRQMFNIFHPFDPVAYRIEPLVCKEYVSKRPIIIPYHRGGKRLHIGFQEFTEGVASRSHAFVNHIHSARVKVLTFCESRNNNNEEEGTHEAQVRDDRSYGSIMMEKLTGSEDGRIDHVLQDKTFRHPYISAIGAHTNYWRDPDTALFILKHLYRDIPEDTHSPGGSLDGNSKHESDEGYWYGPNEEADEETPLTFADSVFLKKFSRRARRILKHKVH